MKTFLRSKDFLRVNHFVGCFLGVKDFGEDFWVRQKDGTFFYTERKGTFWELCLGLLDFLCWCDISLRGFFGGSNNLASFAHPHHYYS